MPYKTKDGRLVNEVTLGDGYPLSNNLQPIKVAGEASAIEVAKALPDESNNAKVKIKGDLEVTGTTKGVVDESDIVHISGTETITGSKTFSQAIVLSNDTNLHLGTQDNNDYIYSDGANINVAMDDSDVIQIKDIEIRSEIPIKIQEASSANGDTAGKGQIWVKNDTPNNLYFTNDAGNDVQITNGSSLASGGGSEFRQLINAGFNYSSAGGTLVYIPLVGCIIEWTSQFGRNEYVSYVAPYDGYLNQVVFRSEEACGSTVVGFHKSSTGTESPNSTPSATVTVDMATDDTPYKFAFSSSNTFSAGEIINISFDPTNDANDVVFTAEFILDSSSGL